jgi:glycosyltransferase involved in cell wall biosynthesis
MAYPDTLKNRARLRIARTADAIVSNSGAGDAFWNGRIDSRVRRFVIPNALPLDEIEAAHPGVPAGLPIEPGDRVVLFAGRFGPEKNVEMLVDALGPVVQRPRTIAVLCGDGPLRPKVQQSIRDARLEDRILTPGYVADIWPLMKRADATVSVGWFEGRPNAVLEAMACGSPLVVSDIPAHREILDERSASWVDPARAASIASGIAGVLDNPAAARGRAAAARDRAAGFSIASAAAAYDCAYREVLSSRRGVKASRSS